MDLQRLSSPARLTDQVAADLARRIEAGELLPGHKLPAEKDLAERFGVSRPIIREALTRLRSDGLIQSRQGSGAYVCDERSRRVLRMAGGEVQAQTLAEVFEVRLHIESAAAELAAARRSEAELVLMRDSLAAMEAAVRSREDGVAPDLAFHSAVAQATRNASLCQLLTYVAANLRGSIEVARRHSAHVVGFTEQAMREHHAIYQGIAAADPDAARAAMRAHLHGAASRLGLHHVHGDAPPRSSV